MNYERFFVSVKAQMVNDLGINFDPRVLDHLALSLSYRSQLIQAASDQYRSKASKVPAFYNPNTHTVHFNIDILKKRK